MSTLFIILIILVIAYILFTIFAKVTKIALIIGIVAIIVLMLFYGVTETTEPIENKTEHNVTVISNETNLTEDFNQSVLPNSQQETG